MVNNGNIPTYQQQAGYTATINPTVPQGSPAAFGTTVAKEQAGFNENLAKLGDTIAQHAIKMQQQEDDNAVVRQENLLRSYMNEVLYDPNNGLAVQKGHKANGATVKFDEVVDKTMQDAMSNMGSDIMRTKLAERTSSWLGQYRNIISRNEGEEVRTAYIQDIKTNYTNAAEVAMKNPGANSFLTLVMQAQTNKADYMHWEGWSSETTDQVIQEMLSKSYEEMAEILYGGGETQALLDLFEAGHGKVTTDAEVKVSKMSNEIKTKQAGFQIASKYANDPECRNADGTFNAVKAREKLEAEKGPNAKKTVRKFVGGGSGGYSGDSSTDSMINSAAAANNVDPLLVAAIASVETGYNQNTNPSSAGAIGMMQLMPDTAAGLGVDPNDKAGNINGGAKYIKELLDTFGGDTTKAIAAYNAGPQAVKDYGGTPPYPETQAYVQKVQAAYNDLKAKGGTSQPVDLSDIPMQNFEDKGLAKTNNTLKAQFRGLYDWAVQEFGKKVEISGGWRSEENNRANNGAPNSHHLYGSAIDVNVSMLTDAEREAFINKAREMGFNKGGDDFYHDKGTGYHAHLVYEDTGSGEQGHWEEVEVSAYNAKEYEAALAEILRLERESRTSHDESIKNAINAVIPSVKGMGTMEEVKSFVQSQYPNMTQMDIDTIAKSVFSATIAEDRQDASYARQQKNWARQDAEDAFYSWKVDNPSATDAEVLAQAQKFGLDPKTQAGIQASMGIGGNLEKAYAWGKDGDLEKTFNDVCSELKITGIAKSNVREKLNEEARRRMTADPPEPPMVIADIRSFVQDEGAAKNVNDSWLPFSGTSIRPADLPSGFRIEGNKILDSNDFEYEYDESTKDLVVKDS